MEKLPLDFYLRDDVLQISQELLGKVLMTCINGVYTGGIITETEAYRGPEDRASHAYGGRRTKRNEVMYHAGGHAYVYRIYGIHAMFNIVTNSIEIPHAILIRAIKPTIGVEQMIKRRYKTKNKASLAGGPGTLTQALGIDTIHNGLLLTGPLIWLEDHHICCEKKNLIIGPRVGIDYAGEHAHLPWRFIYALEM
ncbi:putative 3-methyladenine DNA glycosylase [Neochlamydia sp. AcF65]|uniref:DNA-3-methyladenine glycosylase n=1 Tax=unclassified Neochlamydia TaxID=2643326 RepID=UPI0014092AA1|nr:MULTISPECIES: DNA-3-methyladenine glycosylase [unclassified Neochlamydia]MBS4166650.1 putative 3-methyladenine DNA glycosylase [Neochlamydia sp. AcF65]NGY95073.1 putative 3-methyladenine DNA glycosylase [Neochlamydia sp. AcF84]